MNRNTTWNWIILAAALFVFIFFFERHLGKRVPASENILGEFNAADVTTVQVRPAGQPEIRVDRTNGVWQLTRPISYPAQSAAIEGLLSALQELAPAKPISARELRQKPDFEAEYGFAEPQFSINVQRGDNRLRILIGALTAPGDQVFLEIVGVEGVYVVDADLLKTLPRSTDDWRDTTFVNLKTQDFDRLMVTTGGKTVELERNSTNRIWTMIHPLHARADNAHLVELLQGLQTLHISHFVADGPETDLELFGLRPAELEVSLAKGTNVVVRLQFGKDYTNASNQIFARRSDIGSVVTVSKALVAPWRANVNEFRDHHLLTLDSMPERIEIRGEDTFVLQRDERNAWKIESQDFPVDPGIVQEFVNTLCSMQIVEFKDAVTGPDLISYGLEPPSKEIILNVSRSDGNTETNAGLHIFFGKVQDETIFARRSDEDPAYLIKSSGFVQLPMAAWQFRQRRLWNFTENDVTKLIVKQDSETRELLRNGTNSWSLAPGSQGIIKNVFAVEETVHRFGELSATVWTAHGDENREKYGFSTNGLSLTFELKDGTKKSVEFGGESPTQYPYAATALDGQMWIFEFPFGLYQLANSYIAIKKADLP